MGQSKAGKTAAPPPRTRLRFKPRQHTAPAPQPSKTISSFPHASAVTRIGRSDRCPAVAGPSRRRREGQRPAASKPHRHSIARHHGPSRRPVACGKCLASTRRRAGSHGRSNPRAAEREEFRELSSRSGANHLAIACRKYVPRKSRRPLVFALAEASSRRCVSDALRRPSFRAAAAANHPRSWPLIGRAYDGSNPSGRRSICRGRRTTGRWPPCGWRGSCLRARSVREALRSGRRPVPKRDPRWFFEKLRGWSGWR